MAITVVSFGTGVSEPSPGRAVKVVRVHPSTQLRSLCLFQVRRAPAGGHPGNISTGLDAAWIPAYAGMTLLLSIRRMRMNRQNKHDIVLASKPPPASQVSSCQSSSRGYATVSCTSHPMALEWTANSARAITVAPSLPVPVVHSPLVPSESDHPRLASHGCHAHGWSPLPRVR